MSSKATFAKIYSETVNQIDRYQARVNEGLDVDAAKFFANWLFWSGLVGLLKENSTAANELGSLKCDGPHLAWKLDQLISACNEFYVTNKAVGIPKTDLGSIREKLDKLCSNVELVAGQVSRLTDAVQSNEVATSFGSDRGLFIEETGGRGAPAVSLIKGKTSHF